MDETRQPSMPSRRKGKPAWYLSLVLHAGILAVAAVSVPAITYHRENFGRPIQVVQQSEPEQEQVLPRWEPEVEMPPSPTLEHVLEPVQEVVVEESEPLAGDVVPDSSVADPADSYPVCAVGLRTRPRTVRPATTPAPAPAPVPVVKVPKPPPLPVAPPPPVVEPQGPSRAARILGGLRPRYPERQRTAGRSAVVMLLIHLDERGQPSDVRILSNDVDSDFVDAAIAAAKRAKYQPALVNGKPVPSDIRVRIRFQLH